MQTPERLPVMFRASKARTGPDAGYICAIFPTVPATMDGGLTVYDGAHGAACPSWVGRRTRPATPEEYAPLLAQLRGLYERAMHDGDTVYSLHVVKRTAPAHREAFRAELRRLWNLWNL